MYELYQKLCKELTAPGADFEIVETEVLGRPCRVYAKAPSSLRDVWLSTRQFADHEYLIYGDERLTYADAHRRVANLGAWLKQQGVESGDRVAIAMRNYPEWLLSYWAVVSVGATVVGMNAWWTAPEMQYAIDDSRPRVLIVDESRFERLDLNAPALTDAALVGVRLSGEAHPRVTPWREAVAGEHPLPEAAIDTDSVACIFYTSGTTGRPKGAQLTHRGCVSNIFSMVFFGAVQRMLGVHAGLIDADEVPPVPAAMVTTPLFHVTANNCISHAATVAGGKLVHLYKWDAANALQVIERERITSASGVPVMARELVAHPNRVSTDTSSLLSVGGGGAQLQPDLVHKIAEAFPSAKPSTAYGMTETCGIITAVSGSFFIDKPESCGLPMPCFEVKIVDVQGDEVPLGEPGELWVRGAQVIRGYLNREDATRETIQDGWLRTGDVARSDEHGFIYLVDRIKDMVLRGGENVYCSEVESALFEHPAVIECAVFSVPDDRLGEEVGAAVYLRSGGQIDADGLREHCKVRIAAYKIPRYIWLLDEPLPRNASGKFLKRTLKDSLVLSAAS